MHVLWLPKQSKWENSGEKLSEMFRELPKPHAFDLFLLQFFAKISPPKKKNNQNLYNHFINGNRMEEWFEPAKEEAVRIFLEGGVPTSC